MANSTPARVAYETAVGQLEKVRRAADLRGERRATSGRGYPSRDDARVARAYRAFELAQDALNGALQEAREKK